MANLCETFTSTVTRIKRHAARHGGAIREPRSGKGKKSDPRWHFGGRLGLPNSVLLDRVAGGMDASSTHAANSFC